MGECVLSFSSVREKGEKQRFVHEKREEEEEGSRSRRKMRTRRKRSGKE